MAAMFDCLEALLFETDDELFEVNDDVDDEDDDDDLVLGGVSASAFGDSDFEDDADDVDDDDEARLPSWLCFRIFCEPLWLRLFWDEVDDDDDDDDDDGEC